MASPLAIRNVDLSTLSPLNIDLLYVFLTLLIASLVLATILLALRRCRQIKETTPVLPLHKGDTLAPPIPKRSRHRRTPSTLSLSFTTSGQHQPTSFVNNEKVGYESHASSPPSSPIPEIRVTFADEFDESGNKQTGRVCVVHVGDNCIGMSPLQEELPPYQKEGSDYFQSFDVEKK